MAYRRVTTEQIIEALRETNGLIVIAAHRLGISPTTIYNRAKRVRMVRDVIDEAREGLVDNATLMLRRAVLNGEPWAIALVLKTLGKNRGFTERQEITGAEGGAIQHNVTAISPELVEFLKKWQEPPARSLS